MISVVPGRRDKQQHVLHDSREEARRPALGRRRSHAANPMRHRSLVVVALLGGLGLLAGCGAQQAETSNYSKPVARSAPPTGIVSQDRTWILGSHRANLAEIATVKVTRKKLDASEDVKEMAEKLFDDHAKLDITLVKTVRELPLALPSEPSAAQRATVDRLAEKSKGAFDRAFVADQIRAHRAAIKLTRTELANGHSPKILELARHTLPILQKHLRDLRNIRT